MLVQMVAAGLLAVTAVQNPESEIPPTPDQLQSLAQVVDGSEFEFDAASLEITAPGGVLIEVKTLENSGAQANDLGYHITWSLPDDEAYMAAVAFEAESKSATLIVSADQTTATLFRAAGLTTARGQENRLNQLRLLLRDAFAFNADLGSMAPVMGQPEAAAFMDAAIIVPSEDRSESLRTGWTGAEIRPALEFVDARSVSQLLYLETSILQRAFITPGVATAVELFDCNETPVTESSQCQSAYIEVFYPFAHPEVAAGYGRLLEVPLTTSDGPNMEAWAGHFPMPSEYGVYSSRYEAAAGGVDPDLLSTMLHTSYLNLVVFDSIAKENLTGHRSFYSNYLNSLLGRNSLRPDIAPN